MPVSVTTIEQLRSSPASSTLIAPPDSVNLTAFDSRFQMTCCSRSRSPETMAGEEGSFDSSVTPLAAAAVRTTSSAASTTVAQVHRLGAELQLAGDDARQLDQIFDDARLRLRVAFDARHGALDRGGIHVGRADDLEPAEHRVEGRAEFVRYRGEELVLEAIAFLGLLQQIVSLAVFLLDDIEHRVE